MSQAHIHLLITHLPIFGSLLGLLVLIHAIWMKSESTKIAAYNVFILSAIGAAIAYGTGEGAEEAVEGLPGVTESAIEQHEDFAMFALVAMIVLAVASLLGVWFSVKKNPLSRTTSIVILLLSLTSFGITARTGYLGGQIRHTEIANGTATSPQEAGGDNGGQEEEDD